jgi:TolA-binding protein
MRDLASTRLPGRAAVLLGALLLAVPLSALPVRPAHAQMDSREAIRLHNEILELRQEVQGLRNQGGSSLGGYRQPPPAYSGGDTPAGDVVAKLVDRIARLEDQVRTLQGRVDEADNARKMLHDDLQKEIDDINYKLGDSLAAGGAAGGPRSGPPLSPPPGNLGGPAPREPGPREAGPREPAAQPPRTPELAMQQGSAALARRDYATAQSAAKEVLANPRSPRANDAQFLLAQALAGKRDYSGAAVAYDDAYNRSKKGPHAQDALLGLAHSLTAINEKRAACVTLEKLNHEFPSPRRDLREAISSARQQASCR